MHYLQFIDSHWSYVKISVVFLNYYYFLKIINHTVIENFQFNILSCPGVINIKPLYNLLFAFELGASFPGIDFTLHQRWKE